MSNTLFVKTYTSSMYHIAWKYYHKPLLSNKYCLFHMPCLNDECTTFNPIGGVLILQPGVFLLLMKANVTVTLTATETVTCGVLFMATRFPYSRKAD